MKRVGDYMDYDIVKYTRGARNNNPANIRRDQRTKWIGLSSVQNDKEFCQFVAMEFGVRAFLILCRTYRQRYGIITVKKFIERFAPACENDVKAYVKYVTCYVPHDLMLDIDYFNFVQAVFRYESAVYIPIEGIQSVAKKYKIKIVPKTIFDNE